jgi:hypothetical protein
MRMKDWKGTAVLAALAAAHVAAYTEAQAPADPKAAAVMADVRKTLGGEQKIAGVKGLSLRAGYRREMSGPMPGPGGATFTMSAGGTVAGRPDAGAQTSGTIEIDVELPDRYRRSDVGTSGFSLTRTEGFEGTRPFVEVVGNSPGMRIMADSPAADPARAKSALKRSSADLARMLLGLTGGTQAGFPVTYAYGGEAESPDGRAHIILVTGPEDFNVKLFVDTETKLPLMLIYMEPEPRVMMRTMTREGAGGQRPAPHAGGAANATGRVELTPEERAEMEKARKEAEAAPQKLIEYRLFFSEYKKVDGILLPHHITRATAEKTIEEWDVTTYKVNPAFKADTFKVGS